MCFCIYPCGFAMNEDGATTPIANYSTKVIYELPQTLKNDQMQYDIPEMCGDIPSLNVCQSQYMAFAVPSIGKIGDSIKEAATEIQNLTNQIKDTVCNKIGNADIRIWISIGGEKEVGILNASIEGGVEAIIHCNSKK